MSDDPNKKQSEGSSWSGQQSGQKPGQQSEQRDNPAESQKRPSQGRNEADRGEQNERGGQRQTS